MRAKYKLLSNKTYSTNHLINFNILSKQNLVILALILNIGLVISFGVILYFQNYDYPSENQALKIQYANDLFYKPELRFGPALLGYRDIVFGKENLPSAIRESLKNTWPPSIPGIKTFLFDDLQNGVKDKIFNKNNSSASASAILHNIHSDPPFEKIALIIPYRSRPEQLRYFLLYNLPVFIRQNLLFKIYLIEQNDNGIFNRAKLHNVGFEIASSELDWDCYFFHDVDLMIENDENIYTCKDNSKKTILNFFTKILKTNKKIAKHYSGSWTENTTYYSYTLNQYKELFGGVTAITKNAMLEINGLSNEFWGWGGEDDDFYNRLIANNYQIARPDPSIARYKMITHTHEVGNKKNDDRYEMLKKFKKEGLKHYTRDGLSTLKYNLESREVVEGLFERIVVDVFV